MKTSGLFSLCLCMSDPAIPDVNIIQMTTNISKRCVHIQSNLLTMAMTVDIFTKPK